jgi:hypothetical protein
LHWDCLIGGWDRENSSDIFVWLNGSFEDVIKISTNYTPPKKENKKSVNKK